MFIIETFSLQSVYLSKRAATLPRNRTLRRRPLGDTGWNGLGPSRGTSGSACFLLLLQWVAAPGASSAAWAAQPCRPRPVRSRPGPLPSSLHGVRRWLRSAFRQAKASRAPSREGRPERAADPPRGRAGGRLSPGPQGKGGRCRGRVSCAAAASPSRPLHASPSFSRSSRPIPTAGAESAASGSPVSWVDR